MFHLISAWFKNSWNEGGLWRNLQPYTKAFQVKKNWKRKRFRKTKMSAFATPKWDFFFETYYCLNVVCLLLVGSMNTQCFIKLFKAYMNLREDVVLDDKQSLWVLRDVQFGIGRPKFVNVSAENQNGSESENPSLPLVQVDMSARVYRQTSQWAHCWKTWPYMGIRSWRCIWRRIILAILLLSIIHWKFTN